MTAAPPPTPRHQLNLWDTVSIIVGIIIGAGIFKTPPDVFNLAAGPVQALAIWVLGGTLCLIGAFCFAELGSTYPRSGGEYVYLTRAFGSWMGFLFAWAQLAVIRTGGSIAMLAYVFADYLGQLFGHSFSTSAKVTVAVAVITLLTLINILGVHFGKWTQNLLTTVKVMSLAAILVVGFFAARALTPSEHLMAREGQVIHLGDGYFVLHQDNGETVSLMLPAKPIPITLDGKDTKSDKTKYVLADLADLRVKAVVTQENPNLAVRAKGSTKTSLALLVLALIPVLWTYAGWHEGAYVAAEVRRPQRNLPLALLLGTGAVILLYVLVNAAYMVGLGYERAANSNAVAADLLDRLPWGYGKELMCVLVLLSTLGGINGMVFTSARIFSEFGRDHRLFALLGRWHPQLGTPVASLLAQGLFSVAFVVVIARLFEGKDPFESLLICTAAVFWLFFFLVGVALIILRYKDRGIARPFSTPAYPLAPLIFCAFAGFMVWGSFSSAWKESLIGLGILLAGAPLYFLSQLLGRSPSGLAPVLPKQQVSLSRDA